MLNAPTAAAGVLASVLLLARGAGGWQHRGGRTRAQALAPRRGRAAPSRPAPRLPGAGWVVGAWRDATATTHPRRVVVGCVVAAGTMVAVSARLGGRPMAMTAAAAAIIAPVVAAHARRGRRAAQVEAALAPALEAMARSLRSGASLRQAVGEAATGTDGALGRDLQAVDERADGEGLVAALDSWGGQARSPAVGLTVAALCLAAETGGPSAQAIDGVATTLRQRRAAAAEVRSLSTQARLSALVIAAAPLVFGIVAAATDRRTARFVFHTPVGLASLSLGLTLDGLGGAWMAHLARAAS